MLTRAYDAIMASLQVPMITNQNVDFNNSAIDDSVLNCKNYNGNVRTIMSSSSYNGTGMGNINNYSYNYPFAFWSVNNNTCLLPDEEESAPDYEDYSVANGTPSGWAVSSTNPSFQKTYDPNTKEFVCSVTVLWQNTSGAATTVYGVKVRCYVAYRTNQSGSSGGGTQFLVCREHFAAPVVVEDQGIISLTFTWRVGRAGLVSATAAAAE